MNANGLFRLPPFSALIRKQRIIKKRIKSSQQCPLGHRIALKVKTILWFQMKITTIEAL
jgi:hypothetical protein